ncbi:MAG TPA: rhombosortase [Methylibium sp.]|uniref:rhombosortase n=1 Tax=Methylibium sp. TaxID=2067992 RepID=UPI002DB88519|nr:rhombosortase [Methylibium sp.]HEU4460429.1 rhombosortase [Methylibium sp.]
MPSSAEADRRGALAWLAVAALLALPAAAVFFLAPGRLDALAWKPELVLDQPQRAWTAAWVHLSRSHLLANLAGAALIAAFGIAARLPPGAALAWLLAWPPTHWCLLAMPALACYGGLSGVLHAGVAVIAVELVAREASRDRRLGTATAALLCAKVLSETPWRGPLAHPPGADFATAPIAHATGAAAGALLALAIVALRRLRS